MTLGLLYIPYMKSLGMDPGPSEVKPRAHRSAVESRLPFTGPGLSLFVVTVGRRIA